MTKTRDELIVQIAEELKILGAGQPLQIEDKNKIDGTIDPAMAELAARGILGGVDINAIPDQFFIALSQWLARMCAAPFGLTGQELADVVAQANDAHARMLAMTLPRASGQKAQPEFM